MKHMILKGTLLLAVLLLLAANLSAAGSYGFKVSGGVARMGGDATDGINVTSKFGFSIGLFYEKTLSPTLSVQPELLFVQRGIKKEDSFTEGSQTYAWKEDDKFNYIQIPILIKYNIPTTGKIKPSLFVGPSVAINLSGKSSGEYTDNGWLNPDENISWEGDVPNVKALDFSAIVGGGISFVLGGTTLFVDVRYDMSFGTAFDDMTEQEIMDAEDAGEIPFVDEAGKGEDLTHKSFHTSLGIKIPIL